MPWQGGGEKGAIGKRGSQLLGSAQGVPSKDEVLRSRSGLEGGEEGDPPSLKLWRTGGSGG